MDKKTIDTTVTSGSSNLITSGAVYTAINSIPVGTQELYLVESFSLTYTLSNDSYYDGTVVRGFSANESYTYVSPNTSLKIGYKGYKASSTTTASEYPSYRMTPSIGRDIFKVVTNFNNVSLPDGKYTLSGWFGDSLNNYYMGYTIVTVISNNAISSCTANGEFGVVRNSSIAYKGRVLSFEYNST